MTAARNTERQQNVREKERNGEEKKKKKKKKKKKNKQFLKIAEQQSLHANKKLRLEKKQAKDNLQRGG